MIKRGGVGPEKKADMKGALGGKKPSKSMKSVAKASGPMKPVSDMRPKGLSPFGRNKP